MIENVRDQYDNYLKELWYNIKTETEQQNLLIFDQCTTEQFVNFVKNVSTGPPIKWGKI